MPKWYQSLYWRIAIGFVLFLAAVLALQGGALVYLIARMEVAPGPPPPEVTRLIARDLSEALAANPQARHSAVLPAGIRGTRAARRHHEGRPRRLDRRHEAFRRICSRRARSAECGSGFVRARARRARPRRRRSSAQTRRGAAVPRPGQQALRRTGPAGAIIVDGVPVGVVIAMPRSALRQLGPTLATVGALLVRHRHDSGCAADFRPGPSAAAKPRRCRAQSRRGRSDGSRARRRRRRGGGACARVQSDDARSSAARRRSCRPPIALAGFCSRTCRTS